MEALLGLAALQFTEREGPRLGGRLRAKLLCTGIGRHFVRMPFARSRRTWLHSVLETNRLYTGLLAAHTPAQWR